MMRKHIWISLLEEYADIGEFIKENVMIQYNTKVKNKIVSEKKRYLKKLNKEAGYNQVIGILDLDP